MKTKQLLMLTVAVLLALVAGWLWLRLHQGSSVAEAKTSTGQGAASPASSGLPPSLDRAGNQPKAATTQTADRADKIQPNARPAWVEALFRDPTRRPRLADMKPLSPELEAELIAYYRSLPSITNKLGLAGALAYAGGEASVDLLIYSLTREYEGRRFKLIGEGVQLAWLTRYLGLAAAHSERAYQFLCEGLNPAFWTTNATWSAPYFDPVGRLPGLCIDGLSVSGRDDAWELLLKLKTNPGAINVVTLSGHLCDAAFDRAMMAEMGREKFLDNFWLTEASIRRMREWWKTPAGKEWHEWMERVQGIK